LSAIILIVAAVITHRLARAHGTATRRLVARTWGRNGARTAPKGFYLFMAVLTCGGFHDFSADARLYGVPCGLSRDECSCASYVICAAGCARGVSSMTGGRLGGPAPGKLKVFTIWSLIAAFPILVLTNLPRVPIPWRFVFHGVDDLHVGALRSGDGDGYRGCRGRHRGAS